MVKLGKREISEFGLQFGDIYWKIVEFVVNRTTRDAYVIFPIPDVGLHLSIHLPKPPMYPETRLHWRSNPEFGIDEEVDTDFSDESLQELAMDFLEDFGYYQPSGDKDMMVFHNVFTDALLPMDTESMKVDLGRVMQAMCNGTFYQTKAERLPSLVREIKRRDSSLDLGKDLSICALSEDRLIIPLSSRTMIEYDIPAMRERLRRADLISIFNPMQRAMETISRTNPNLIQEWLPINGIGKFFEETSNAVRYPSPRIINF